MLICNVNIPRMLISHKNSNKRDERKNTVIFIYNINEYIGLEPVAVTIVKTKCKVQMIT